MNVINGSQTADFFQNLQLDQSKIDWNADFMNQMYSILKEIRVTDDQKSELEIIKHKLRQAIYPLWPDAKISSYGSTLTGAWLCCSDLDFSVDSISPFNGTSDVSTIGAQLSKVKDFSQPKEFALEVPRLFIIYTPTERHFDVTFNNEPSKATTALLATIMSIDERVLHVTMLIKFWTKVHGLGGSKRMASTVVYTLVIFYLQQEGLLPSVASMLDNSNYRFLNGWNVAIKKTHVGQRQLEKTYLELLGGFFEYYEKFTWHSDVVSTFSGTIHYKYDFLRNKCHRLPDIFTDYKRYVEKGSYGPKSLTVPNEKYAYIQDPLFLSENLAANFDRKYVWYLKTRFAKAAKCYRSSLKNNGKEFLKRMFIKK